MPPKEAPSPKPSADERKTAGDERRAEREARRAEFHKETAAQRDQARRGHLRRQAPDRLLLRSPSMAVFEITVTDAGKLTATEVAPAELTAR